MENNYEKNVEEILDFWFGEIENGLSGPEKSATWYQVSAQNDQFIAQEFGDLFASAKQRQLEHWLDTDKSSLALILLLDQFSRNIHRGTEKAFASDFLALEYCLKGLSKGLDNSLSLVERAFYYHPLMHAESLAQQETCVTKFASLLTECNQGNRSFVENGLHHACQHRDIIQQFGRFPHRNGVLNRLSTPEELDYLKRENPNYGQK